MVEKLSLSERVVNKIGIRPQHAHYVTQIPEIEQHRELYQLPHVNSMYSQHFELTIKTARNFCNDISKIKYLENTQKQ
jgi:hypothetical protein